MSKTKIKVQDTDKAYKCPHCESQNLSGIDPEVVIANTEPIFTGDYEEWDDAGLYWIELIKCHDCKKLYIIENGA